MIDIPSPGDEENLPKPALKPIPVVQIPIPEVLEPIPVVQIPLPEISESEDDGQDEVEIIDIAPQTLVDPTPVAPVVELTTSVIEIEGRSAEIDALCRLPSSWFNK